MFELNLYLGEQVPSITDWMQAIFAGLGVLASIGAIVGLIWTLSQNRKLIEMQSEVAKMQAKSLEIEEDRERRSSLPILKLGELEGRTPEGEVQTIIQISLFNSRVKSLVIKAHPTVDVTVKNRNFGPVEVGGSITHLYKIIKTTKPSYIQLVIADIEMIDMGNRKYIQPILSTGERLVLGNLRRTDEVLHNLDKYY